MRGTFLDRILGLKKRKSKEKQEREKKEEDIKLINRFYDFFPLELFYSYLCFSHNRLRTFLGFIRAVLETFVMI